MLFIFLLIKCKIEKGKKVYDAKKFLRHFSQTAQEMKIQQS